MPDPWPDSDSSLESATTEPVLTEFADIWDAMEAMARRLGFLETENGILLQRVNQLEAELRSLRLPLVVKAPPPQPGTAAPGTARIYALPGTAAPGTAAPGTALKAPPPLAPPPLAPLVATTTPGKAKAPPPPPGLHLPD